MFTDQESLFAAGGCLCKSLLSLLTLSLSMMSLLSSTQQVQWYYNGTYYVVDVSLLVVLKVYFAVVTADRVSMD